MKIANDVVTWLKQWFYDEDEIDTKVQGLQSQINNKASQSDLNTTNSNVTVLQALVDGKVDKVVGKGLSTEDYTSAEKTKLAGIEAEANKTVVDSSLNTESTNPVQNKVITVALSTKANQSHNHSISQVSGLQTQLSSLDSRIDNLESIKAIEVVSTLPTASADTMNRLYIISENNKINVYYTEQNGSSYSWHKMDSDILDELSIDWSDVLNNPFSSSTPSSFANAIHNHDDRYYTEHEVQDLLGFKADTSHNHTASDISITDSYIIEDWGVSNQEDFDSLAYNGITTIGHNLQNKINTSDIANNLTTTTAGKVLDARQGKILSDSIITSIYLVPKSSDANGKIIFYTGDEPSNNS